MFTVTMTLKDLETKYSSFKDAFIRFYDEMKSIVNRGTSLIEVQETCWMSTDDVSTFEGEKIISFYDARDMAYKLGIMTGNGVLNREAKEPTHEEIVRAYSQVQQELLATTQ